MLMASQSAYNDIKNQVESSDRGTLFFPDTFASMGSSDAVRSALVRLCENGILIRVAQGIYYFPKIDTKWGSGVIHRRTFIGLRGFDYSTLLPQTLNIVPPADIQELWRQDYRAMQESMIYGDSPSFDQLIEKMTALSVRINSIKY